MTKESLMAKETCIWRAIKRNIIIRKIELRLFKRTTFFFPLKIYK